MCWKKTTDKEALLEYEFSGRRESFRLESEVLCPALGKYKDRLIQIVDISAGGISFECDNCHEGEKGIIQLELPGKIIESVSLPIQILTIIDGIICHCNFTSIDEETKEKIHKFILFRQIAAQRKKRTIKEKSGC